MSSIEIRRLASGATTWTVVAETGTTREEMDEAFALACDFDGQLAEKYVPVPEPEPECRPVHRLGEAASA